MSEPVIALNKLTKSYGKHRGIEEISFTVERGEIFGFIGPNGAGKSTTIRTLMGLLKPTGGTASVFGLDCGRQASEIAKDVGYLPVFLSVFIFRAISYAEYSRKKGGQREQSQPCPDSEIYVYLFFGLYLYLRRASSFPTRTVRAESGIGYRASAYSVWMQQDLGVLFQRSLSSCVSARHGDRHLCRGRRYFRRPDKNDLRREAMYHPGTDDSDGCADQDRNVTGCKSIRNQWLVADFCDRNRQRDFGLSPDTASFFVRLRNVFGDRCRTFNRGHSQYHNGGAHDPHADKAAPGGCRSKRKLPVGDIKKKRRKDHESWKQFKETWNRTDLQVCLQGPGAQHAQADGLGR